MKYHFRISRLDDGRFLAQSIEHFYCTVCRDSLAAVRAELDKVLHKYLSEPSNDLLFCAPLELSLEKVAEQFGYGALEVVAINVEPSTALALTLRRLRSNRCLNQRQIAKQLGLRSLSHYQRLEDPLRSNPTLATLVKLQSALPRLNIASLFEPPPK